MSESSRSPTPQRAGGEDHVPSRADPGDGERLRRGARTVRTTAIVAFVGLVVALLALGYASLPLRTPTQDCGTALAFLLEGRSNELVDPNAPGDGFTTEEAVANSTRPCQERAAGRARRAGLPFLGGIMAASTAFMVEQVVRYRFRARARRAWLVAVGPPLPPPPLPAPPKAEEPRGTAEPPESRPPPR